jgi:hypothetical protein
LEGRTQIVPFSLVMSVTRSPDLIRGDTSPQPNRPHNLMLYHSSWAWNWTFLLAISAQITDLLSTLGLLEGYLRSVRNELRLSLSF